MRAEIVSIGTEILLGDIVNTNARYLSKRLAELGIYVYFQTVVGDNPERVWEAYDNAFQRADLVIISGGLGPTEDDITKEIAGKYFKRQMVFHPEIWEPIHAFYVSRGSVPTDSAKKQASFPEGSDILKNAYGTAPGCWIEQDGKCMAMMPGPPKEMIPMFEQEVVPKLAPHLQQTFRSRILRICGVGESQVEEKLLKLIHRQDNPTIAPYAKEGEVHVRVTARADSVEAAEFLLEPVVNEIHQLLGALIYAEGELSLEGNLYQLLTEKRLTLSVAESMTGGLICARLVNVSGMSSCLKEGMITYGVESKIRQLDVDPSLIEKHGVVSKETALAMARGAANASGTDIGLAVTGWAEAGEADAEAGLMWIGLFMKGNQRAKRVKFSGNRNRIRFYGANMALCWLLQHIKNDTDESIL